MGLRPLAKPDELVGPEDAEPLLYSLDVWLLPLATFEEAWLVFLMQFAEPAKLVGPEDAESLLCFLEVRLLPLVRLEEAGLDVAL